MSETSDYDDDFDARDALNDLIEDLPSRQPSQLQNHLPASSKDSGITSKNDFRNPQKSINPSFKKFSKSNQNFKPKLNLTNSSITSSEVGRIKSHPLLKNQNSPRRTGTANSSARNPSGRSSLRNSTFLGHPSLRNSTLHPSSLSNFPQIPKKPSVVSEKVAEARRKKQSELMNLNGELASLNDELTRENRLLKAIQRKHENSLNKYENLEGELPTLINQHSEQRRVDKANLREARRHERQLESQMSAMNKDLSTKESLISRMKAIVEDRELRDAEGLKKRLVEIERELVEVKGECEKKDKKYNLDVGSLERQLKTEKIKSKQYLQQIQHYQKDNATIQTQMRAKDRAITDMAMRNEREIEARLSKSPKKVVSKTSSTGSKISGIRSTATAKNSKSLPKINSQNKSSPNSAPSSESRQSSHTSFRTKKMANLLTKNNDDRVENILKTHNSPHSLQNSPQVAISQAISPTITNVSELPAINLLGNQVAANASKMSLAGTSKWGGSTMIDVNTPRSMLAGEAPSLPAINGKSKTSVNDGEETALDLSLDKLAVDDLIREKQAEIEEGLKVTPEKMMITPVKSVDRGNVLSPPLEIQMVSSNECTPSPSDEKITSKSPTLDDLLADTPSINKPKTAPKNAPKTAPKTLPKTKTPVSKKPKSTFQTEILNECIEIQNSDNISKTSDYIEGLSSKEPSDLETILMAPAKHHRKTSAKPSSTNIASIETGFNDFISTNFDIEEHNPNKPRKSLSKQNSASLAFSPLKAPKTEYNFSPEVNNLYKGHPAGGPLGSTSSVKSISSRKNSFDEIFKPKSKIPNSKTSNTQIQRDLTGAKQEISSAESIFGNGDNTLTSAVQNNITPSRGNSKFSFGSQATMNRAKSPMHIDEDLEEIFY